MKRFRVSLTWLCVALLTACQSPPRLTFAVITGNPAWTVWHASASPNVVLSLATQAHRLWVGTSFGVWQIDLQTQQLVRYDALAGAVSLLLPIENGQVWAGTNTGLSFFDGQHWRHIELPSDLEIGGVGSSRYLVTLAIDWIGDLALQTSMGRWGYYTVS